MREAWDAVWGFVWEGFRAVKGNGQYPALFFVGLAAIAFYKDKREKQYWYYGIAVFVCLLFPPCMWALQKYQTGFYSAASLWALVPVTGMTAYGAAALLDMAEKAYGKQAGLMGRRYGKYVLAGLFCTVILLSGGFTPVSGTADPGGEKIPEPQRAALEWIAEHVEEPCVWAPREVAEYARAYSGEIRLLYGRNMWEEALNAYTYDVYTEECALLYAWMEGQAAGDGKAPPEDMERAVETAMRMGCNVLVLRAGDEWAAAGEARVDAMGCLQSATVAGEYRILTLTKGGA